MPAALPGRCPAPYLLISQQGADGRCLICRPAPQLQPANCLLSRPFDVRPILPLLQRRLVGWRSVLAGTTRTVDYCGALLNYVCVAAAVFSGG